MVFVNYFSEHLVVHRSALLASAGFPVVVADNSGSFPATPSVDVQVVGVNLGFGAACNLAVSALPDDVRTICFHNPDAVVRAEALDELHGLLRGLRRAGAVAPAERVGGVVRERGYRYPAPARELALGARALRRRPAAAKAARGQRVARRRGRGARFPSAAVLVVDRLAHERIGGFDEDFFLYAEDLDYWHRLRSLGHDCRFVPEVVFRHDACSGSPIACAQREVLRWLGVELFAHKHGLRWRRLRAGHRMLLPLALPKAPALAAAVGKLWSEGMDPSTVMQQLRPALGSGELLGER